MKRNIGGLVQRVVNMPAIVGLADQRTRKYWSHYNVTLHHEFADQSESLDYFHWRNDQYFNYIKLMPVTGQDGKVVLDYGCGPGHDLVGFGVHSVPRRLIGIDISPTSLEESRRRLALHDIDAELILLDPAETRLPVDDDSVNHLHCSGVLHHTPDPVAIMREFHRVLKDDGTLRVMVYNKNSVWLHLWVAYENQLVRAAYRGLDLMAAFARTTDGKNCPISVCYAPEEFLALAAEAGFKGEYLGAAVSMLEASLFQTKRFPAIQDRRLPNECRQFLIELEVDRHGLPVYRGTYAGIDACFEFWKHR